MQAVKAGSAKKPRFASSLMEFCTFMRPPQGTSFVSMLDKKFATVGRVHKIHQTLEIVWCWAWNILRLLVIFVLIYPDRRHLLPNVLCFQNTFWILFVGSKVNISWWGPTQITDIALFQARSCQVKPIAHARYLSDTGDSMTASAHIAGCHLLFIIVNVCVLCYFGYVVWFRYNVRAIFSQFSTSNNDTNSSHSPDLITKITGRPAVLVVLISTTATTSSWLQTAVLLYYSLAVLEHYIRI